MLMTAPSLHQARQGAVPVGSPNRNRQVERQVDRKVERQVDNLFGSKNRQVEKSGRKSGWKKPSSWP